MTSNSNSPNPAPGPAAPNVLLVGATGTGKTYSIRSLVPVREQVLCVFTEPGYTSVLGDIGCDQGLHFAFVPPAQPSFATLLEGAKRVNTLTLDALAKLQGVNKQDYGQFLQLLSTLHQYRCERCGREFGDASTWPNTWALVVDSLSGLNIMAMDLVAGGKPIKAQADWQIAMDTLDRLITKLCVDTRCMFVLTAHLEREHDEVTGSTQLMAATLGRKLAPRIPRFFDDVIHCTREGDKWYWNTATLNVDLKARNLPWAVRLEPDFRPLLGAWKQRAGEPEAASR